MNRVLTKLSVFLLMFAATANASSSFFELQATDIDGKTVPMSSYKGKVIVVVNTASQCGFTPQLKELTELQTKYSEKGFQVLAFPSNDFKQDKGSNLETKKFSEETYHINFPLFDKAPVTGSQKQPVYQFLEAKSIGFPNSVLWNFEKFLINRKGQVVERYRSMTSPTSKEMVEKIEKLLAEKE